jgi:hypothetical protein
MALSADRATSMRGIDPKVTADKAAANTTIYLGSLVGRDDDTGLCLPATDDADAGDLAGVALSHVTADGLSDTPKVVIAQGGDYLFDTSDTFSQALIGTARYVSDDHTTKASGNVQCGVAVPPFVDTSHCFVRIDGYAK